MNTRTVENMIVLNLNFRLDEDEIFKQMLQEVKQDSKNRARQMLALKLLQLYSTGGEEDEKTIDPFDEFDRINIPNPTGPGPDPDVPVGKAPERANTCSCGAIHYNPEFPGDPATTGKTADPPPDYAAPVYLAHAIGPKSYMADVSPEFSRVYADTPDTADRLAKLADICGGRGESAVAEEFDKSARRAAKLEWDKPRR